MHTHSITALVGAAAALTLSAGALASTPVSLTVDPELSSVDVNILIDVGITSSSASDSSTLSGNIEIEIDDAGNPSEISMTDLMVELDETLSFNWSFGFFGDADASMSGSSLSYSNPGVAVGPVPVTANAFAFPDTLFDLGGLLDVSYDILLVGTGSQMLDLGTQDPFVSPFDGNLVVNDGVITLSTTIAFDVTQPLTDQNGTELGTATFTGTATIVATGEATVCVADLTGDGLLNFFDVSAFLNAFSAEEPAADFTGDGLYNFFDVSAFLNAFSAGCP